MRKHNEHKFRLKSIDGKDVSAAWELLSGDRYDSIISDCLRIREERGLCDWAYLLMLDAMSRSLLGDGDEATMMTAYMFSQSGYKMRLGTDGYRLYLLFGTQHQIYGQPHFKMDGSIFYVYGGSPEGLNIADFAYPGEQDLSLAIRTEQAFDQSSLVARSYVSGRYGTAASCHVSESLIHFFDKYPASQLNDDPLTRWALYANTPLSSTTKEELYRSLRTRISGKSAPEAADILLDFVQNAFVYGYDDQVWGGDRAFFAEETLYYPFCDCEDRSILYSHLVRDLLGLDVVLVYYPGHLATAVKFMEPVPGDQLSLRSGLYTICDPTYIGAPIGATMPDMDNSTAKVILLGR